MLWLYSRTFFFFITRLKTDNGGGGDDGGGGMKSIRWKVNDFE